VVGGEKEEVGGGCFGAAAEAGDGRMAGEGDEGGGGRGGILLILH
jgi:hypothetical protein